MRYLFSMLVLIASIYINAENAFVDYNQFYFEGEGYSIINVKGSGSLWKWENRSLIMTNFSEQVNDNNEYAATESWVILGPYDFSRADSAELEFNYELIYGANATSVVASNDFPGYHGEAVVPGTWETVMDVSEIETAPEEKEDLKTKLSNFAGDNQVYVAFKYVMPLTSEVRTNRINLFGITRNVPTQIKEMLPQVDIRRSNDGTDYFNMNGTVGETKKWSVRTGYAKASSGNNLWLVFRSFNLTTSGDAFFSFQSMLTNGSVGPQGLEIKISREKFEDGMFVGDVKWDDYSIGRVDHRNFPSDYFESGKLDLSKYLGSWVTVAFRYINPIGEQYSVKDFQMFHLPDITPPEIQRAEITRLVYNKAYFTLRTNEVVYLNWGVYPSAQAKPTYEELLAGTHASRFGEEDYTRAFNDSTYVLDSLMEDNAYKLYYALTDYTNNHTEVNEIAFNTPGKDLKPPELLDPTFSEINNFGCTFSFDASKPTTYYILVKGKEEAKPNLEEIQRDGEYGAYETSTIEHITYTLKQNTEYVLYWFGRDYADNESNISAFPFTTSNRDLRKPVIVDFNLSSKSDFTAHFSIAADEAGTVFYAVQNPSEAAPSPEGIISGERAYIHGDVAYNKPLEDVIFTAAPLHNHTPYAIYTTVADSANNYSLVKVIFFETNSATVPQIAKVSDQRILIDREAEYTFDSTMINITNGADANGYAIHVFEGEHYTSTGAGLIAADNYTGGLMVPVCLYKDTVRSNLLHYNFIVDNPTVQDSLEGPRRNMAGKHLNTGIDDLPTSLALLQLREDGSFFDQPSPLSPDFPAYMTKVLGGRMINIASDYSQQIFRIRKANEIRHKMYMAVEYWLDNKPEYFVPDAPLLWPDYMGAIILALYDDMMYEYKTSTKYNAQIERIIAKTDTFNKWCWEGDVKGELQNPYEGYNLAKRAWGTLALAAVSNSSNMAYKVYDTLNSNMVLTNNTATNYAAGLMPDGSFTHHNKSGNVWNWYAYGYDYLSYLLEYSEATKRTNWRLPKDKFDMLSHAVVDGANWLQWGNLIPFPLLGKNGSEQGFKNRTKQHLSLLNAVRYQSFVYNSDLDDNEIIYDDYNDHNLEYRYLDSTKYFWNANVLIHSRGNYINTLFIPSSRTGAFETGKDTILGLQSFFMGDGAAWTINNEEAYNMRFLLDHNKLPGTTVERRNITLDYNIEGTNGKSNNAFAGGVSNGEQAVASFYYDRARNLANVNAYKSYFYFNNGYVALGAGINKRMANKVYNVGTTLEQEVHSNDIKYSITKGQVASISANEANTSKEFDITEDAWFYTDGKGFYILPAQDNGDKVNIDIEERTESWDLYNGTYKLKLEDDPNYQPRYSTRQVFTLEIDHGKNFTDAKYAYMVVPGMGESDFIEYVESQPIEVLANSDTLQAVYHKTDKTYGIVFMQAGSIQLNEALTLSVDNPAIVLLKENARGEVDAWISDPLQTQQMVEVTFDMKRENALPEIIQRLVILPTGIETGKSAFTTTGNVWDYIPPQKTQNELSMSTIDPQPIVPEENKFGIGNKAEEPAAPTLGAFQAKIYPVPVQHKDMLSVQFVLNENCSLTFKIVNSMGQVIQTTRRNYRKGEYNTQLYTHNLSPGLHWLLIDNGNISETKSFIVK